jgi:iron complex outermembrane receptor protein
LKDKVRLLASSSLAVFIFAGAAHAQQSAPTPAAAVAAPRSSNTIEELVVTAEKREQSLQDVPVAISAYTSEKRDLVGINSVQDMTNFTPGLTYNNSGDRISLRGIGRVTNVQAADGAVAIYSDGVFSSSSFEASKQPLFIDRVEVLRGPQGTLYGRNSIGGAINVLSKRPSDEFGGEVRATYGNYNYSSIQATVTGPIADGLDFRLNASRERQTKGYFDNIVPGMPDSGNVINQTYFEAQFSAKFGEHADGWIKISNFNWNNGDGGLGGLATYTRTSTGGFNTTQEEPNVFYLNGGFGCSGSVTNVVNTSPLGCTNPGNVDPRKIALDTRQNVSLDGTFDIAAQYTYHFDNFDLKYIGGGTNYHYTLNQDNDGTAISSYRIPVAGFNPAVPVASQPCAASALAFPGSCGPLTISPQAVSTYQEDKHWMSHELNLASSGDGALQWLVGAYYYKEGYRQPVTVQLPNQPQFATPANGVTNNSRYWYQDYPAFHDESYAGFGQVDWKATDTVKLTGGLRYSHDHKYGQEEARLICFALDACGFPPQVYGTFTPAIDITSLGGVSSGIDPVTGKLLPGVKAATRIEPDTGLAIRLLDDSWHAVTGTAGVEWTPSHDTLVYAKYSRGYKAGGFNSGITAPLVGVPTTNAEHNNAYEIGWKQDFGRTLQVNLAAYYYDYRNFQAPVTIPATSGTAGTGAIAQSEFFNVPKAISKGFEAEINWNPIDNLRINASYSYDDAYIKEASGLVDPTDPTAIAPGARPVGLNQAQCAAQPLLCVADVYTGQFQQGQNLKGNALPQAPKNKVAINALYTLDFNPGSLTGSVSYFWRDVQYGSIFQRYYNRSPSWDQVDLRLTWKDAKDRYNIIGYVKNVFNDLGYYEGATSTRIAGRLATGAPTVLGIASTYPLTPPRTYGVELQYRF